jgi:hypothetical protein
MKQNEYEFMRFTLEELRLSKNKKDFFIDINTYQTLLKIKRAVLKHHKLCEMYCDVPDFNPNRIDKQEDKIKFLIGELPIKLNLKVDEIGRDPRGWEYKFNNYWFSQWVYMR